MEAIKTKAMKGIKSYLEQRDDLVFIGCQLCQNSGEGFPEEVLDRDSLERLAAAYLAEHLDTGDCAVRFDAVSMLTLGDDRALLRHHQNALCTL